MTRECAGKQQAKNVEKEGFGERVKIASGIASLRLRRTLAETLSAQLEIASLRLCQTLAETLSDSD